MTGLIVKIMLSAFTVSGQSGKQIIKGNHILSTYRINNGNVGFLVDNHDKTNTVVSAQGAKKFDYHPVRRCGKKRNHMGEVKITTRKRKKHHPAKTTITYIK